MINNFKNAEKKFLETNAAVWFNKTCWINKLTLKYIHIKMKGNNQQSKNTKLAAIRYWLNYEFKFLYKKETGAEWMIVQNSFRMCKYVA
jgi:hypothetical protein